ncbi:MAG: hypothetical protein IMZ53_11715 [Thermoplasmata archaeon]|nr:hypothetical protein [Thermoplasmata archaeon]
MVRDEFDNSASVKLEISNTDEYIGFNRLDGKIKIVKILFTKDYDSKIFSDINLFCKFEGNRGELFEGNFIELNTDGNIHQLNLTEARIDQYERETGTSLTLFTRIGPFTFSDSTRTNVNIIAMDLILSGGIQEAILGSKKVMLRILTKNIDGVSKNTFNFRSKSLSDLKQIIKFSQAK